MSPFFGTVEYFEQKIKNYLGKMHLKKNHEKHLTKIVSQLENEIRYDFTCHDRIKKECLDNLFKVSKKASKFSNCFKRLS